MQYLKKCWAGGKQNLAKASTSVVKYLLKGPVSGLKQFLATKSPLKMVKNSF